VPPTRAGSIPGRLLRLLRAGIKALFTSEPMNNVPTWTNASVLGRFAIRRGMTSSHASRCLDSLVFEPGEAVLFWNLKKVARG